MRSSVKSPVAPCEYIEWALSVPGGARFDLTKSGMPDAIRDETVEQWQRTFDIAAGCRRDAYAETRARFVDVIARRYAVETTRVVPTLGASQAIMQTLLALVRPGDHVVVERPTYEPLHRVPELLGAEVSRLERKPQENWAVLPERLAKLLTPRTRAVVISNLHNPSGLSTSAKTMTELGDMAARVGALVLCDEVYLDYDFRRDGELRPTALTIDNGISWSSTSKCFGFGALRVGWIVAPSDEVANTIRRAASYLHMTLPNPSLQLATWVLDDAERQAEHARRLGDTGRRVVNRWLDAESRVRWSSPQAGLTGLLQLPALTSDRQFCEHLRQRYDTQVVPGSMFEAEGHVRLSYGLSETELEQALANISDALDDLCG